MRSGRDPRPSGAGAPAVAVIGPFTKKWVIDVSAGQGLIGGEQIHDFDQGGIDVALPP